MICECGKEVDENLKICENCGREIIHKKLPYKDSLKYQLDKIENKYKEKEIKKKKHGVLSKHIKTPKIIPKKKTRDYILAGLMILCLIGGFIGIMVFSNNYSINIENPQYFENEIISSENDFRYVFSFEQSNQTMYNFSINIEYNQTIRKINGTYFGGGIDYSINRLGAIPINENYNINKTWYNFQFYLTIDDSRYSQIVNITISWICLNITYYEWDIQNNP